MNNRPHLQKARTLVKMRSGSTWLSRLLLRKVMLGVGIMVMVGVVIAANTHLVYVAIASQPDCVSHQKTVGDDAKTFRAAKPSC